MKRICVIGELGVDIALYLAIMFKAEDISSVVSIEDHSRNETLRMYMEDNSMAEYMGIRISSMLSYKNKKICGMEKADVKIVLMDNSSDFLECFLAEETVLVTNLRRDCLNTAAEIIKKTGHCHALIVKDYVEQVMCREAILPVLEAENRIDRIYLLEPDISDSRRGLEIQYGKRIRLSEVSAVMADMLTEILNRVQGTSYTVDEMKDMLSEAEKKL